MATIRETPEGKIAETTQAQYRQAIETIRNDTKLTAEGKRQRIAEEYLLASRIVNGIKAKFESAKAAKVESLRRDLFGRTGTSDAQSAISFRDAQERVGNLERGDDDKAVKLLDQATLSGDEVMVKAVMQKSMEMQWEKVADTYISKHPQYGDKLKELWDLQKPASVFSRDGMDNATLLSMPKPTEISGLWSDQAIQDVANGN